MAEQRLLSNKQIQVRIGPAAGVTWSNPTLAQVVALEDVSEAIKWDGFDFNLEASDQVDDRALTDEAGAQSRSYDQFGGPIPFFTPQQDDQTSIYRIARDLVKDRGTDLAIAIRVGVPVGTAPAAGQEWNVYHVLSDSKNEGRGEASYFYTINFVPKDDVRVGYILPSSVPTAVTISPATPISAAVGDFGYLKASYEGRNITIGATYTSSDESVVTVTRHGVWYAVGTGSATITPSYPGSAAGTPLNVTIS